MSALPENIEELLKNLPDAEGARRFFAQFSEQNPSAIRQLKKEPSLLSDLLTIASYSPLLATTMLQNPSYTAWLGRQRISTKVRGKEELLESLARFALVNSDLETNILLARFRRRELLRIYLRDIRNLGTIVEITEEISNLADAILEYALRLARQELDNRYGIPLETDRKDRTRPTRFCIVALGKLGSKELNYASDIDLLFLYSEDGSTSGQGTREAVTNREYFVKLAEFIIKLVGGQSGEGAAYRVDLRLRPDGRVGHLALPLKDAINYYQTTARAWERQVLIRSRASAGDAEVFRKFFARVENLVFSKNETVVQALENVRLSKEQINLEKSVEKGFNVKLGRGGIREIEFIAQALQLAYSGRDEWLRAPHTLISLSRLADRGHVSEKELTQLFEAYTFLRRIEHRLQMRHGLQTHLVPDRIEQIKSLAKMSGFYDQAEFQTELSGHTANVSKIFKRIFGDQITGHHPPPENVTDPMRHRSSGQLANKPAEFENLKTGQTRPKAFSNIILSLEKSEVNLVPNKEKLISLKFFADISPNFARMLSANPALIEHFPTSDSEFTEPDYRAILLAGVEKNDDFAGELSVLRKNWSRLLVEIAAFDVYQKITRRQAKILQTRLAEASIETAIMITRRELGRRLSTPINEFPFAVLGLGKLGGGGMDYGSDLDLVLIYDDERAVPGGDLSASEFYTRAVGIFVNILSGLTRDGLLYRVDLRLRPDGKNSPPAVSKRSFLNYLESRSAIWEWLAYVKLRGVAGWAELAGQTEAAARNIIHENARKIPAGDLCEETRRVRLRLQKEKTNRRKTKEIDIKYGEGGMLDVYFAIRFLQLRDNIPDQTENRSTLYTLEKLLREQSLNEHNFQNFTNGYRFLTELDHNLRLTIGRSTRLPLGNKLTLQTIVNRMKLSSVEDMLEKLTFHRLNIRDSFEAILDNRL